MTKDNKTQPETNVVSLTARREQKLQGQQPRAQAPGEAPPPSAPGASAAAEPVDGRLFWLYCPTCHTLEYTELAMSGGRIHGPCGTRVQEASVDLDLRAEFTIAHLNLERVQLLETLLRQQRTRYQEYQHRLGLAAGVTLQPYDLKEGNLTRLDVVETDGLGLLISRFFSESSQHFPDL
ncbi:MAG: hypothetical protein OEW39_10835, partial [Deltaproteobacteria bacterium]|nr:hypothetical protein [Deltaproteobacteria bacterium]